MIKNIIFLENNVPLQGLGTNPSTLISINDVGYIERKQQIQFDQQEIWKM